MTEERVKRRLAAILAADVVGYSRLMGDDEAATLATLKEHHAAVIDPQITGYDGRIVKLMGDGTLAEFTSVVDAVQSAVACSGRWQHEMPEFPRTEGSTFVLVFTWVMSFQMATIFTATVSMLPRAWRLWPSQAAFAFRARYVMP